MISQVSSNDIYKFERYSKQSLRDQVREYKLKLNELNHIIYENEIDITQKETLIERLNLKLEDALKKNALLQQENSSLIDKIKAIKKSIEDILNYCRLEHPIVKVSDLLGISSNALNKIAEEIGLFKDRNAIIRIPRVRKKKVEKYATTIVFSVYGIERSMLEIRKLHSFQEYNKELFVELFTKHNRYIDFNKIIQNYTELSEQKILYHGKEIYFEQCENITNNNDIDKLRLLVGDEKFNIFITEVRNKINYETVSVFFHKYYNNIFFINTENNILVSEEPAPFLISKYGTFYKIPVSDCFLKYGLNNIVECVEKRYIILEQGI